MLLPPHPTLCNISTASIGCVGLSLGNGELGCQWGVLGVCRLTGAQAAICHPTLASLIFIPNPAWPSRPAVSSPQKGFLLWVGGVGETKAGRSCGGAPQRGPLTWSLAWQGRQPRQTALCLLPASFSLLSATQTLGANGETEEGRGGGEVWQTNTMKRLTQTTPAPTRPFALRPLFISGHRSLYSPRTDRCPLLLSAT